MQELKSVVAALKAHVNRLVVEYNRHLPINTFSALDKRKQPRSSYASRQHMRQPAQQLRHLVPLLTALVGLSQQPLKITSSGARAYLKRFERLRSYVRDIVMYGNPGAIRRWFPEDVQVLLADAEVDPSKWRVVTVDELAVIEAEALRVFRDGVTTRRRAATGARNEFLRSLAPEQVQLLVAALEAAKESGVHAVTFDERDLAVDTREAS